METLGQPLKVIAGDYLEVAKDTYQGVKSHPIKTLFQCLLGAGLLATWKTRPDGTSYRDCLLGYSNEVFHCSSLVRNPQTHSYVSRVIHQLSRDQLYCRSFGFFAVMVERENSPTCKNYHMVCKHTRGQWWTVWRRVVDVGVWGRWWMLERRMVDLDVNEEELATWLQEQKKF